VWEKLEIAVNVLLISGLIVLGFGIVQFVIRFMVHYGIDDSLQLAVIGLSIILLTLAFSKIVSSRD